MRRQILPARSRHFWRGWSSGPVSAPWFYLAGNQVSKLLDDPDSGTRSEPEASPDLPNALSPRIRPQATPPIHTSDSDPLPLRLKHLIASRFRLDLHAPHLIADDEPLIGGRLGVDSLDALELAICLEEEFGLTIRSRDESQRAFANIRSLAGFIRAHRDAAPHATIVAIDVQSAVAPSVG